MYRLAFEFGLLSKGAAAGFLLIGMNLVLAYAYIRFFRRQEKTVGI
jgi:ABC-type sugar transport system permease subunit